MSNNLFNKKKKSSIYHKKIYINNIRFDIHNSVQSSKIMSTTITEDLSSSAVSNGEVKIVRILNDSGRFDNWVQLEDLYRLSNGYWDNVLNLVTEKNYLNNFKNYCGSSHCAFINFNNMQYFSYTDYILDASATLVRKLCEMYEYQFNFYHRNHQQHVAQVNPQFYTETTEIHSDMKHLNHEFMECVEGDVHQKQQQQPQQQESYKFLQERNHFPTLPNHQQQGEIHTNFPVCDKFTPYINENSIINCDFPATPTEIVEVDDGKQLEHFTLKSTINRGGFCMWQVKNPDEVSSKSAISDISPNHNTQLLPQSSLSLSPSPPSTLSSKYIGIFSCFLENREVFKIVRSEKALVDRYISIINNIRNGSFRGKSINFNRFKWITNNARILYVAKCDNVQDTWRKIYLKNRDNALFGTLARCQYTVLVKLSKEEICAKLRKIHPTAIDVENVAEKYLCTDNKFVKFVRKNLEKY